MLVLWPVFGTMDSREGYRTLYGSGRGFDSGDGYDFEDFLEFNYNFDTHNFTDYDSGDRIKIKDDIGDIMYVCDQMGSGYYYDEYECDHTAILIGDSEFPDSGSHEYEYDEDWDVGVVYLIFEGDITDEYEKGDTVVLTLEVETVDAQELGIYYYGYSNRRYEATNYEKEVMEDNQNTNYMKYPSADRYLSKAPSGVSLVLGLPIIIVGLIPMSIGIKQSLRQSSRQRRTRPGSGSPQPAGNPRTPDAPSMPPPPGPPGTSYHHGLPPPPPPPEQQMASMTMTTICPRCGLYLEVPNSGQNEPVHCPRCGTSGYIDTSY